MTEVTDNQSFPVLLEFEKESLNKLHEEIGKLLALKKISKTQEEVFSKKKKEYTEKLKKIYKNLSHWDRSLVARHVSRPYMKDYLDLLFTDFVELHGDRKYADDPSFVCGFAKFNEISVAVVGNQKDRKNPLSRNFGMGNPEGYRKALRIFKLADKFGLPILTFIDTPGAYPGKEGEDRGQGEAIASNLKEMFALRVPILSILIGEGGSGGALGIAVGDCILMLENSIYSVISPESFASIIWRDASRKEEAAAALKNDPKTALKFKLIDEIVKEPVGGAHRNWKEASQNLKKSIESNLKKLVKIKMKDLIETRRVKFAQMGQFSKK